MKTYQIIFQGGLTRNIEADGCRRTTQNWVFYMDGEMIFNPDAKSVMTVQEICDFEIRDRPECSSASGDGVYSLNEVRTSKPKDSPDRIQQPTTGKLGRLHPPRWSLPKTRTAS